MRDERMIDAVKRFAGEAAEAAPAPADSEPPCPEPQESLSALVGLMSQIHLDLKALVMVQRDALVRLGTSASDTAIQEMLDFERDADEAEGAANAR